MRELAAVRHRVAGVEREIEQRGGELARIDQRRPGVAREHACRSRSCSPSVGRSSLAASITSALTSTSRGCSGCLRAKASRCWVRSAPRSAASSIILAIGGELRPVGDGFGQDLDRAGDDGQDVVEVVGDAAGQLADRLHLLRLAELRLRGAASRSGRGRRRNAAAPAPTMFPPGQRHRLAVLVEVARLEVAHLPAATRRAHLVARAVEIVGMDELDRAVPIISEG